MNNVVIESTDNYKGDAAQPGVHAEPVLGPDVHDDARRMLVPADGIDTDAGPQEPSTRSPPTSAPRSRSSSADPATATAVLGAIQSPDDAASGIEEAPQRGHASCWHRSELAHPRVPARRDPHAGRC
ncbi:MAG: hypothetical protein MZW92_69770 [Comamonadaceae bacterium]|nr:hypothetical protein [Comamonadaceae bacterium]